MVLVTYSPVPMVVVMLRPGEASRNEHRAGVAEIWGRIAEVSSGKGRVLVDVGGVPGAA